MNIASVKFLDAETNKVRVINFIHKDMGVLCMRVHTWICRPYTHIIKWDFKRVMK